MKKLLISVTVVIALGAAGIVYLNKVYLPRKIRSLVVEGIQQATGKQVTLDALTFSLFKGIVLHDLKISDGDYPLVYAKEVLCAFVFPEIFSKKIVIPVIAIKSPEVWCERRADNTVNLAGLIPQTVPAGKKGFRVFVYRLKIMDGVVHFTDRAVPGEFSRDIADVDAVISPALPASIKYTVRAVLTAHTSAVVSIKGEYRIVSRELVAAVDARNLFPQEFAAYYQQSGVTCSGGPIDAAANILLDAQALHAEVSGRATDVAVGKEGISAALTTDFTASISTVLKDRTLGVRGNAVIARGVVDGLPRVGRVSDVHGVVRFDNAGIFTDALNAQIFGLPVSMKGGVTDFAAPKAELNVISALDLAALPSLLKQNLNIVIPAVLSGKGNLSARVLLTPESGLLVSGSLDVAQAAASIDKVPDSFKDIKGKIVFDSQSLAWSDVSCIYRDTGYKSTGSLKNFSAPDIKLSLKSNDLMLESAFTVMGKNIAIARCNGAYRGAPFSFQGDVSFVQKDKLIVALQGEAEADLENIQYLIKKPIAAMDAMKPQGRMRVLFEVSGDIRNVRLCTLSARCTAPEIFLYGLRGQNFSMNYRQEAGIGDISLMHVSLYGGNAECVGKIDFTSPEVPYRANVDVVGVKIEELKLDTKAKDEDLSGKLSIYTVLNGYSTKPDALTGTGDLSIVDGKLWHLNLFKGLGSLLFVKDFANIVFSTGSCVLLIQDKTVFMNNILLHSTIADLTGSAKIGFNGSLDAVLNVKVLDEMAPLTGTFKDVATAIVGSAGRFGVIKISGTIKEPKHSFHTAVGDIIKGIKNSIFGE